MFEIVVSCKGLREATGLAAVTDVTDEFAERPWQQAVLCWWENGLLMLRARNDYDDNGQALADEFSDAICACTPIEDEIGIRIVSVNEISGSDA